MHSGTSVYPHLLAQRWLRATPRERGQLGRQRVVHARQRRQQRPVARAADAAAAISIAAA